MAANNSFIEKPKTKKAYIEYIRAFAAITVVFLHIVITLPANYTIEQLGAFNS